MLPVDDSGTKLQELPNWYTDVIPFHLPNDIIVPNPPVITSDKLCMDQLWLNNKSNSSWALFHSQDETLKLPQYQDLSAMLPIWRDDSKSPATTKHLLTVLMQSIILIPDKLQLLAYINRYMLLPKKLCGFTKRV